MAKATKRKLVAVAGNDSMTKEFGRLVGWDLNGATNHKRYTDAGDAHGFEEEELCALMDAPYALHIALRDVFPERKYRHEQLKKTNGWSIKTRHHTQDDKGADVALQTELRIFQSVDGSLRFEPEDHACVPQVEAAYKHWCTHVTGTIYSGWLISRLNSWSVVTHVLRGRGGCYFIPASVLPEWDRIVALTHAVTPHFINEVGCFPTDERAVETVLRGITSELKTTILAMNDSLEAHADGEKPLGIRALTTMRDEIASLESKLRFYEDLLGKSLDEYRSHFEDLELTVTQAMMAVEAEKLKEMKEKAKRART